MDWGGAMDKRKISLEPIKKEDNLAIYHIIRASLESFHLDKPGTAYYDPYLNDLYDFYQNESRGQYWILKQEGEVIGGIGVGSVQGHEDTGEIQKYYIKEGYQGLGYGSLLLDQAITYAKSVGYKHLYIETMDVLEKANKIYEHYGFKLMKEPLEGSVHTLMNRWYLKDL